jgi:hypothetical protein
VGKAIGMLVWEVLREEFVAAWNVSGSVDEAAGAIRELACGPAPRWAVLARAAELRREGFDLKPLASSGHQSTPESEIARGFPDTGARAG